MPLCQCAQRLRHLGGMTCEVHQRLDAREHRRQDLRERRGDRDMQRGFLGRHRNRNPATMLLAFGQDAHRAAIAVVLHRFDAVDRAHTEEYAHRRPIEGRPETQFEFQHVHCGGCRRTAPPRVAQLTGDHAVALLEQCVETPHAAKTARERHLGDRQRGIGQ